MDLREFLKRNESVDILRFITCGSVDDGKSTLIGRLLYDAKGIFEDQLNGARNERGEIDFANLVDDERMPEKLRATAKDELVRFRTLGCYPLTGAISSDADTLEKIVAELLVANSGERQGRLIDSDEGSSMEAKKQEGYF